MTKNLTGTELVLAESIAKKLEYIGGVLETYYNLKTRDADTALESLDFIKRDLKDIVGDVEYLESTIEARMSNDTRINDLSKRIGSKLLPPKNFK